MNEDFLHATLGRTGRRLFRLGLSASYRPGRQTVHAALDAGVDYFFCYGFDGQMIGVLKELPRSQRERIVIATGAYNLVWWHADVRRSCEKRLRQLKTDYLDVFLFLGVLHAKELTDRARDELFRLRDEGKVRAVGISTHDRRFAAEMAQKGDLDVLMIRYNAAHRGAEHEIFPHLQDHDPGLVSYTATRWTRLLRRPRGWQKDLPVPTAGMCYRFVLSNPHVDICLTAPANARQLEENIKAIREGPLSAEAMQYMRDFGDAVHRRAKWFR